MSWLVFALAAGAASAVNVAAAKRLVAELRPAVLGGVVHVTGGLLCLAALPLLGADLAPAATRLPQLAVMTIVHVIGNLLYFTALARTQLSQIDLFLRSSALWTVVGGTLVLGDPFPATSAIGALLVLASLATIAERPRRLRFSQPQMLAVGAAVAFGAGNVTDKAISAPFHPLGYTALVLLLTGAGMLAVARPPRRSRRAKRRQRQRTHVAGRDLLSAWHDLPATGAHEPFRFRAAGPMVASGPDLLQEADGRRYGSGSKVRSDASIAVATIRRPSANWYETADPSWARKT